MGFFLGIISAGVPPPLLPLSVLVGDELDFPFCKKESLFFKKIRRKSLSFLEFYVGISNSKSIPTFKFFATSPFVILSPFI